MTNVAASPKRTNGTSRGSFTKRARTRSTVLEEAGETGDAGDVEAAGLTRVAITITRSGYFRGVGGNDRSLSGPSRRSSGELGEFSAAFRGLRRGDLASSRAWPTPTPPAPPRAPRSFLPAARFI